MFDSLLGILYAPLQPLAWHPERAFIVALIFLALLIISVLVNKGKIRVKFVWPLLLAFCSWVLFGINEYIALSNKTDIRIDLLFFEPVIMAISIFAIYSFVRSIFSRG